MRKTYIPLLLTFALFLAMQTSVFATGDDDVFSKSAISIYPNPVVYEANITLDKALDLIENEVSIYFYNIVGEEIHQLESIHDHQFRINKDLFKKSGIYFYQLKVNGEVLNTGKLNIH